MLLLISLAFAAITVGIVLIRNSAENSWAALPGQIERIMQLLDVGLEANIPTWFSSGLFLLCAGLIAAIAAAKSPGNYQRHWWAMAIVFVLLSADEAAALNDGLTSLLHNALDTSGFLALAWVITAILFVVIFVLAYIPFLRALPQRARRLFILARGLFVFGAVGLEMVGAYYSGLEQANDLIFAAIWITEEFLEMLGVSLFVYALLIYLRDYTAPVNIAITNPNAVSNPPSEIAG